MTPYEQAIKDEIAKVTDIANATMTAAKMSGAYSIWDLPEYLKWLNMLRAGATTMSAPSPVPVPTPDDLGNDNNTLNRITLMLAAASASAQMPQIKDAATDTYYALRDLPEWVAGLVAAIPVKPVTKPLVVVKPVTKPVKKVVVKPSRR